MHEEQEATQTTPETDSAAEFEELIQGRCKQPFQQRVQKILDGRLRSLRQENEALRRQTAEQRSFENGCVERLARQAEDIRRLKEKVDAGCEFLTTQMFFDNHILYNFLYKALSRGIDVPVVAGIMPVTNKAQIKRIVSLSGNMVPPRFLAIVDRFGDNPAAMRQAGIAYATDQIIDLIANGVNHVHIYTMNKPDVAGEILDNLSEIYVRA